MSSSIERSGKPVLTLLSHLGSKLMNPDWDEKRAVVQQTADFDHDIGVDVFGHPLMGVTLVPKQVQCG